MMDPCPKDKKAGRVIFKSIIISELLDDMQGSMLSLSVSDQLEGFLKRGPEITLIPDNHN